MTNENLLSISDGHNSNISFIRKEKIEFSASEERFSRKKFDANFPEKSILYLLKNQVSKDTIDKIIIPSKVHFIHRILRNKMNMYKQNFLNKEQKAYFLYHDFMKRFGLANNFMTTINRQLIQSILKKKGLKGKIILQDHHESHAYGASMTSPFKNSTTITIDAGGDGYSSKIFDNKNGRCEFIRGESILNSPGVIYSAVTQAMGFHPLKHPGKITGLAAYGDSKVAYDKMSKLMSLSKDKKKFYTKTLSSNVQGIRRLFRNYKREDVAAALQKKFEEVISGYALESMEEIGSKNLSLAGGCFGNVKLNQRLHELRKGTNIYIFPAMNDEGLSLGASLKYLKEEQDFKVKPLKTIYLGPEYSEKEIIQALKKEKAKYEQIEDIELEIAEILAKGKVVARFNGRMEYGPRALGNRSILYTTTDKKVNDWLNKKLRRTEFMPFAPATIWEKRHECYQGLEGAEQAAKYMTITFNCTKKMREQSPGVVHIDGTARPQIVKKEDNKSFHRIITEYYKITNIPSIINTSFNIHEEPIVMTPAQAIKAFRQSKLDYLAIGNFLVKS